MAINIRSIGANQGIISLSLSASVTDSPAKLSITTLANGELAGGDQFKSTLNTNAKVLNFNGIRFAGSLVGYNRHYEQGKNLITYQYVDNSIFLDQNSLILFRRGLPSTKTVVGKTLRITRLRVTAGASGVNFNLVTTDEYYAVERFEGTGAGGLGREKFTTNPCDQSDVDYDANQALNIIGAPNVSGIGRVSYEGSYRTVLASIYNDAGSYYWWDWRYSTAKDAIKKFNGSISIPNDLPKEGCGILSADEGWTKDGTYTLSSWLFERDKAYEAIDGSASTVVHDYFDVFPVRHPNFPSSLDVLFENIPAYRTAYAIWNDDFSLVGLKKYGKIDIPGSPSGEEKEVLYYKYNFNFNKTLRQNILEYLGVGDGGTFFLVKDLENIQKPAKNMEFFYPYIALNDTNRFGSLKDGSLKIQRVEFSPATTRRGLNPLSGTWEDQAQIVRYGLWRSTSIWIEGNANSSNFDEAVQDCFVGVNHDIFCSLYDNTEGYEWIDLGKEDEKQVISPGSLRDIIENEGFKIVYVRYPKSGMYPLEAAGAAGSYRNFNDTPDLIGYIDPNTISNEDKEKELEKIAEEDKEFNNPCKSIITDFDDDSSYDDSENAPLPGLLSDRANANSVTCNGQTVILVWPSPSAYRVVRRTTAQYSKTIATGSTAPTNKWTKNGGLSSTALSHTVNITDITPGDTDSNEEVYSPESGGTTSALNTFSATCDGFYLPIVPTLESLTATVDSAGLLVSYSYKDIPFKPKLQRNLISSVRTNVSNRMS